MNKDGVINYFNVKDKPLDTVLSIFVRVNSGGTELTYSDLLLSVATAQWRKLDAREEILRFVDELNDLGDGFRFDKDFVLKTALVLMDFRDIAFRVDNYNATNMSKIEDNWEKIKQAIHMAVSLVASFGYSAKSLVSAYSVIPVAYYIASLDVPAGFVSSARFSKDRELIARWLPRVLLKRLFGGHPDGPLREIRSVIGRHRNGFPYAAIVKELRGTEKTLVLAEEEIENLLSHKHGQRYTFAVLSLLYPNLDYRNKFHEDHIHPRSLSENLLPGSSGIAPRSGWA